MRIKFKKLIGFCLLIVLGAWVFFNQDAAMKQVNKVTSLYYVYNGDKAYSHRKLQKAIDNYQHALKLYLEHYSAWFNLGNIYVAYEDFYSAVDAYEQAFTHNPKLIPARMNYGIISVRELGDFDGAIEQYEKIVKTKHFPIFIPTIYNNKKSDKVNKGIAYYNMALAYRQKALYSGDNWILQREYLTKAIENYKESIKILKKDYDAHYNLALTYQLLGDNNNAGLMYCKAIHLSPMQYDAHYNLAILLRHLKYYKESLAEAEKATILITNSEGITNRQRYVFDVMNDVTRTVLTEKEKEFLTNPIYDDEKSKDNYSITYLHGKVVSEKAFDKAMLKNFQSCSSKKIFLDKD